tara:strand:- start:489 stop:2099 length:1611 start_codon:yes stop_codon:yes gene_type:complete
MMTKELLTCATPEAIVYIKKSVNSKSKTDYDKLKKLFDEKKFEASNFEDTELDIRMFNWQSLERDRNWWWQLQALPFLNWYANSFTIQTQEERTRYFSYCLDAIQCWISNAKQNTESPLAWHDHAAAFRVRNLTNWLLFCQISGLPISAEARAESLANLIAEHINWLGEDKHYSKHTNHGFDQAMIALTISLMFSLSSFESHRQLNRRRLKDEVKFAFTEEGVHKENSPGYQKVMLIRLKQLDKFTLLSEKEIPELGDLYIKKAEAFLKAITLPDGYLPMIGDTQGKVCGLTDDTFEQDSCNVYDYSSSGYVIVKGNNKKIGDYFLLIKNCHNSNYHRHDDDLMVYLWCSGDVIFGDAGLYSHNERSNVRKFMRSRLGHSVPFIKGKPIRDRRLLNKLPSLNVDLERGIIKAKSYMHESCISRTLDISRLTEGLLKIKDETTTSPLYVNFYLGENVDFNVIKQVSVSFKFPSTFCNVVSSADFVSLFKGESDDMQESCYVSERYSLKRESARLLFSSTNTAIESEVEFGLLEVNFE